jgi:hypothetical protein
VGTSAVSGGFGRAASFSTATVTNGQRPEGQHLRLDAAGVLQVEEVADRPAGDPQPRQPTASSAARRRSSE